MATCCLLSSRTILQMRGLRSTILTPHLCLPSRRIIIEMAAKDATGATRTYSWGTPQSYRSDECYHTCNIAQQHHLSSSLPPLWAWRSSMSGQQMDASRNQRAHSKSTSSPAPLDLNKCAKTPTREYAKPTRQSRSMHRHHVRGGQSQSWPRQEEVFIPAGCESTYHQKKQKEEKKCRSETLRRHMEKREAEKQEVLAQSCCYISRCTREIKATLRPMDEVVRGFKVFGDNTPIHAAFILTTLECQANVPPLQS